MYGSGKPEGFIPAQIKKAGAFLLLPLITICIFLSLAFKLFPECSKTYKTEA